MPRPQRARRWVFTLNNYTGKCFFSLLLYSDQILEADLLWLEQNAAGVFKFLCFGREVAPTTGTPHLQGYLETNDGATLSAVKCRFPDSMHGIHLQKARGTYQQNKDYTGKGGEWTSYGREPCGQGKRSDLCQVTEAIRGGGLTWGMSPRDFLLSM